MFRLVFWRLFLAPLKNVTKKTPPFGRAHFFSAPRFFGRLFFWRPFCSSTAKKERKKERKKRRVRGGKAVSPKRSAGLQHPTPEKDCWVAKP